MFGFVLEFALLLYHLTQSYSFGSLLICDAMLCILGYGLKCHRVIIQICKMIGIKDLHCKVEGSTTNIKAIAKGFLNALVDQVR